MATKNVDLAKVGVFDILMRYNGMDAWCWCIARSGGPWAFTRTGGARCEGPYIYRVFQTPVGRRCYSLSITSHRYVLMHISLCSADCSVLPSLSLSLLSFSTSSLISQDSRISIQARCPSYHSMERIFQRSFPRWWYITHISV